MYENMKNMQKILKKWKHENKKKCKTWQNINNHRKTWKHENCKSRASTCHLRKQVQFGPSLIWKRRGADVGSKFTKYKSLGGYGMFKGRVVLQEPWKGKVVCKTCLPKGFVFVCVRVCLSFFYRLLTCELLARVRRVATRRVALQHNVRICHHCLHPKEYIWVLIPHSLSKLAATRRDASAKITNEQ